MWPVCVTAVAGLDLKILEYDATFHRHITRAGVTSSSCMSPERPEHTTSHRRMFLLLRTAALDGQAKG